MLRRPAVPSMGTGDRTGAATGRSGDPREEPTMGEQTTSQYQAATEPEQPSGWAVGLVTFAGVMMIMIGAFHAFTGLVALFENAFYVSTPNYLLTVDTTTWGWVHIALGVIVLVAGIALLAGREWARVVGVVLA